MDLIAFWNVVKRRQTIVIVGLCAATVLAMASMVKPTASGFSWRTPPVYDAATKLLVTQPGFPEGRVNDPSSDTSPQLLALASSYASRAESDSIERAVSKKLKIQKPTYDAVRVTGPDGVALPQVEIRAYELSPEKAIALANGVSNALRTYIANEQASNGITGNNRVELEPYETAQEAEVFQGLRLTRPIMLFLLGAILTLAVAFVVDNMRGGRRGPPAEQTGEHETALGIVRNPPEGDDPEEDEVAEEPQAARGRWATPS